MRSPAAVLLLVFTLSTACSPSREKIPAVPEMKPVAAKLIIYQLMTRLFGNTLDTNRPFGTLSENGVGKFNHISPRALAGIKELGTTHIWFTGVLEHASLTPYPAAGIAPDAPEVVKGRAGSPYAIRDYYDVDPDLAMDVSRRMQEFEALVQRTHDAGMGVIIDFIPNHVARVYRSDAKPEGVADFGEADNVTQSFHPANNFYYLPGQSFRAPREHMQRVKEVFPDLADGYEETPAKATGDDKFVSAPPMDSWFETAKLNYGINYQAGRAKHFDPIPDTWIKMRDILVYWTQKNVDGFRCDMAEMVPTEFWNWVIPQVKAVHPEVVFIAEIYNPARYREYIDQGRFDFLYDKVQLYDTLRLLINGRAKAQDIVGIYNTQEGLHNRLVHFMENHDEQRIASSYFAGNSFKGLPAMLVSAAIDSGPVLIYFGQEVGEPGDGEEGFGERDGRTTRFDYWGVPEHQKWMNRGAFDGGLLSEEQRLLRQNYQRLLTTVQQEEAIRSGEFVGLEVLNPSTGKANDRVVAFARYKETEFLIIVAGFNPREESIAVQVAAPGKDPDVFIYDKRGAGMHNLLGDTTRVDFDVQKRLLMKLPPYGTLILKPIQKTDNPIP